MERFIRTERDELLSQGVFREYDFMTEMARELIQVIDHTSGTAKESAVQKTGRAGRLESKWFCKARGFHGMDGEAAAKEQEALCMAPMQALLGEKDC